MYIANRIFSSWSWFWWDCLSVYNWIKLYYDLQLLSARVCVQKNVNLFLCDFVKKTWYDSQRLGRLAGVWTLGERNCGARHLSGVEETCRTWSGTCNSTCACSLPPPQSYKFVSLYYWHINFTCLVYCVSMCIFVLYLFYLCICLFVK